MCYYLIEVINLYGDRIRCLRKYFKLTQGDLAHAVGFKSASAVGMIERGEREVSFEMLGKLADFFNVTTDRKSVV